MDFVSAVDRPPSVSGHLVSFFLLAKIQGSPWRNGTRYSAKFLQCKNLNYPKLRYWFDIKNRINLHATQYQNELLIILACFRLQKYLRLMAHEYLLWAMNRPCWARSWKNWNFSSLDSFQGTWKTKKCSWSEFWEHPVKGEGFPTVTSLPFPAVRPEDQLNSVETKRWASIKVYPIFGLPSGYTLFRMNKDIPWDYESSYWPFHWILIGRRRTILLMKFSSGDLDWISFGYFGSVSWR